MREYYPSYYSEFACLAGECPDSCCRLWDVDVDPETEARYRAIPGALGNRLRAALKPGEMGTVIAQREGKCPLWREDGLCGVQVELGHEALCRVCREFPRIHHDYGTFVEYGLELSCPEAARLILSGEIAPLGAAETRREKSDPEDNRETMEILLSSRETVRKTLADRSIPVGQALTGVLLYAASVEDALYGGEPGKMDADAAAKTAARLAAAGDLREMAAFYKTLEILTPRWKEKLEGIRPRPVLEDSVRPLMAYFVDRYWLQAVSDLDLMCRVKFAVSSCLLIAGLDGGFAENACLYSKEIENDPENMDALFDAYYENPAFTDGKLLYLLGNGKK